MELWRVPTETFSGQLILNRFQRPRQSYKRTWRCPYSWMGRLARITRILSMTWRTTYSRAHTITQPQWNVLFTSWTHTKLSLSTPRRGWISFLVRKRWHLYNMGKVGRLTQLSGRIQCRVSYAERRDTSNNTSPRTRKTKMKRSNNPLKRAQW